MREAGGVAQSKFTFLSFWFSAIGASLRVVVVVDCHIRTGLARTNTLVIAFVSVSVFCFKMET